MRNQIHDIRLMQSGACPWCKANPSMYRHESGTYQIGCFNPECFVRPTVMERDKDRALTIWMEGSDL